MFILKGLPLLIAKISNNRLLPEGYEQREIWHKPAGGFAPLWMRKLARGDKNFWLPEDGVPSALLNPSKDGKEISSGSFHGKMAENELPPRIHSLPAAGVHHKAVEGPHNEEYDV